MSDLFTAVLGVAEYSAHWVQRSNLIKLTAVGALPCYNYSAQLEQRPERVVPPMWSMVFHIQYVCIRAIKPFELSVVMVGTGGTKTVTVYDAKGENLVPVTQQLEAEPLDLTPLAEQFVVYALLTAGPPPHVGCIVVPEGSIVPAIYYKVFGPDTHAACDKHVAENCVLRPEENTLRSGEIPWPLLK